MREGGRIISIGSCVGERMMTPGLVAYDLVCLCFVRPVSVSAAAVGLLVFKQLSRLLTREPPVDLGPFLVGPGGQAGLKAGSPPRLAAPHVARYSR